MISFNDSIMGHENIDYGLAKILFDWHNSAFRDILIDSSFFLLKSQ